jgi:phosphoribosyl 1,2-cyclic phosphodiesterase
LKLTVLGSSSKGNCYLLEYKNKVLILDAGVKFKEVQKALNFKLDKVVGVLVTHEHMDHLKYAADFAANRN